MLQATFVPAPGKHAKAYAIDPKSFARASTAAVCVSGLGTPARPERHAPKLTRHLCSRLHPPSPPKLEARVARQRLTRCRAPPSAAAELAQDVEGADDGHEDQGQHQDRGGPHL
ncbi:unnamed protein product, partial [Prorocentrum cordatum]